MLTPQPDIRVIVGLLLAPSPVPMLLGTTDDTDDADWLSHKILAPDGGMPDDLLELIADGIAETYFGRPRWQARVIWRRGLANWPDIDGELSSHGVDLMSLPPDRATNTVFRLLSLWIREDKQAREAFTSELSTPPAAVEIRRMKVVADIEQAHTNWNAVAALAAQAEGG